MCVNSGSLQAWAQVRWAASQPCRVPMAAQFQQVTTDASIKNPARRLAMRGSAARWIEEVAASVKSLRAPVSVRHAASSDQQAAGADLPEASAARHATRPEPAPLAPPAPPAPRDCRPPPQQYLCGQSGTSYTRAARDSTGKLEEGSIVSLLGGGPTGHLWQSGVGIGVERPDSRRGAGSSKTVHV